MNKHDDNLDSDGEPPEGFWAGLMNIERRNLLEMINFIVWLTAGAVIGWFANRMITAQHERRAVIPTLCEDDSSAES